MAAALNCLICWTQLKGEASYSDTGEKKQSHPHYFLQSILLNLVLIGGVKAGDSRYSLLCSDYFWLALKVIYYRITHVRSCSSAILHKASIAWASFTHCPGKEESSPMLREWLALPAPPAPDLSAKTDNEADTSNSVLFCIQNSIFFLGLYVWQDY